MQLPPFWLADGRLMGLRENWLPVPCHIRYSTTSSDPWGRSKPLARCALKGSTLLFAKPEIRLRRRRLHRQSGWPGVRPLGGAAVSAVRRWSAPAQYSGSRDEKPPDPRLGGRTAVPTGVKGRLNVFLPRDN